jgi:hypothetical protein
VDDLDELQPVFALAFPQNHADALGVPLEFNNAGIKRRPFFSLQARSEDFTPYLYRRRSSK